MNQNNPNLLFYSKKCKTCEMFINTCHNNNVLKYLKLVCIDDNISTYSAKGLKLVPTLIIQGNNTPIEGKNVFAWLENLLNTIKINNNESVKINNQPLATNIVKRNKEEPVITNNSNVKNNNIKVNKNIEITQEINNKTQTPTHTPTHTSTHTSMHTPTHTPTRTPNGPTVKKSPFGYLKDEMDGFSDSFAYLMTDNPLPKSFTSVDKEQAIYTAPEGNKLDRRTQEMLIKTLETERVNEKNENEKIYEMEHYNLLNKR
jgi:hypothetical protein